MTPVYPFREGNYAHHGRYQLASSSGKKSQSAWADDQHDASLGHQEKFVIYCTQMVSPGSMLEPLKLLISEENYEIEQRDMLISSESAEDLLAYRKADLIFSIAPIHNRSVVCTHFTTVPIALICRADHPRLADTATVDALYREKFTFTRVLIRV